MAVRMINAAIRRLNFAVVRATLEAADRDDDDGFFVCEAREDQWHQYVRSESQALKSRAMEWRVFPEDATAAVRRGRVYIVELPSALHESLLGALGLDISYATGTRNSHLIGWYSTYIEGDWKEPGLSYGPSRHIGAVRPAALPWGEFHTLKVEIEITRRWSQLNARASHWATIQGVEYVLLLYVTPQQDVQQYTLYEVNHPAGGGLVLSAVPANQEKIAIQPADARVPTTIQFDSRRLLALPANAPIPQGFAEPTVEINTSQVVEDVIDQLGA